MNLQLDWFVEIRIGTERWGCSWSNCSVGYRSFRSESYSLTPADSNFGMCVLDSETRIFVTTSAEASITGVW